jgi:PPOX class probable F420-dependent enzyme
VLTDDDRVLLGVARRAVLATIAADGHARLVPICFVVDAAGPVLYTPLDDKPKSVDDPWSLARVRDISRDDRVSVLVDRWDEDWTRLAWLRLDGRATLLAPSEAAHPGIVAALRAKYPQYATHGLDDRPLVAITIERATRWGRRLASARGRARAPSVAGSGSSSSPGDSRRR